MGRHRVNKAQISTMLRSKSLPPCPPRRASELDSYSHPRGARIRFHLLFFFLNDTAPTEISPLPLHDALPISQPHSPRVRRPPPPRDPAHGRRPRRGLR